MNFSQVAEVLHISREGARKRILKYQDHEDLQEFLIKDETGKVIGLKEDGIELLRNIGSSRRSFAEERNQINLKARIEILEIQKDTLQQMNDNNLQMIKYLQGENVALREQIQKQNAELEALKKMSFWQRLTYKG